MKRIFFTLSILGAASLTTAAPAQTQDSGMTGGGAHGMGHMMTMKDDRTALNAPPMMKEHQKKMMREHLRSVREIVGLMGEGKFEEASKKAHTGLGLTDQMDQMCGMFGEDFKTMGIAFHKSGDRLGDALATKDLKKSIAALGETLDYCVSCHDTFKH